MGLKENNCRSKKRDRIRGKKEESETGNTKTRPRGGGEKDSPHDHPMVKVKD